MIKAQFKLVKEVILLTRSNLLANSIKDNLLDADFFYIYNDYQALVNFHNKINLLIIDLSDLTLDNIWHHKIKTIVNLTSKNKFSQDEIISNGFLFNMLEEKPTAIPEDPFMRTVGTIGKK